MRHAVIIIIIRETRYEQANKIPSITGGRTGSRRIQRVAFPLQKEMAHLWKRWGCRVALSVISRNFPSHVFNAHVCATGKPHGKVKRGNSDHSLDSCA